MTALVGIRCKDGVVIGTDGSATLGDSGMLRTIEQPTSKKIEIIGEQMIIAGTGYVGHMQRFASVVKNLWNENAFQGKSDIEVGKLLSSHGLRDFDQTHTLNRLQFSALVAYPANDQPSLCELPGGQGGFQPEIKKVDDLWFTSAGGGQTITDPFLALMRRVFWSDSAPALPGGIFTALWTLQHACEINPGGINEPIKIAVLSRQKKGQLRARILDNDELEEHRNMVTGATAHLANFREILEGKGKPSDVPMPKA